MRLAWDAPNFSLSIVLVPTNLTCRSLGEASHFMPWRPLAGISTVLCSLLSRLVQTPMHSSTGPSFIIISSVVFGRWEIVLDLLVWISLRLIIALRGLAIDFPSFFHIKLSCNQSLLIRTKKIFGIARATGWETSIVNSLSPKISPSPPRSRSYLHHKRPIPVRPRIFTPRPRNYLYHKKPSSLRPRISTLRHTIQDLSD